MKNFNLVCVAGGALIALACFLTFGSAGAMDIKVKDLPGGAGKIMWIFGIIIAVVGVLNKRWLHILSLLLGAFVLIIAFKWTGDLKTLQASQGIGSWLMIGGAVIAVIGSVLGLLPKKKPAL